MQNQRGQEKEEIKSQMAELKGSMESLEEVLSSLKTKAYDNVSAKLQVFEDEFFSDLTARSKGMQEEMESWKKENRAADGRKRPVTASKSGESRRGSALGTRIPGE
jgi:ElaB/YqjD/DUF883 family membrane-anchored ribosome-binding protein